MLPRLKRTLPPKEEPIMPRFLVERTFPDGLAIPLNQQGAEVCLSRWEQLA